MGVDGRSRAYVRLTIEEQTRFNDLRGTVAQATYCRQATLWMALVINDYLDGGHTSHEVSVALQQLLRQVRPDPSRHSRSKTKQTLVEVRADDEPTFERARLAAAFSAGQDVSVLDISTFHYLALMVYLDQQQGRTSFADLLSRYSG